MHAQLANIGFDCDDVLKTAGFWSAVLGQPLDEGSSEGFASIGGSDGARDSPAWYFHKVPEPRVAKNRVHVDLIDPDPEVVDQLVALGATVVEEHDIGVHSWTVLEDLEGHVFCVAAKAYGA